MDLLVSGYTRCVKSLYFPFDIIQLIINFYPKFYQAIGIGYNLFGEFGTGADEELKEWRVLQQFTELCKQNPYNIYQGKQRFLIVNALNELYAAGDNQDGGLGKKVHNDLELFCDCSLSFVSNDR